MSESIKSRTESVVRVVASLGTFIFVMLALKVGAASWHARIANTLMPNWKGGTMNYEDGFKVTAFLVLFAAIWSYCALKPKSVVESWDRSRRTPRE